MSQNISSNPIPKHVAIIPDGNRRWAKSKGMKPWEGHEAGAKIIEQISQEALKLGVKYITFWGSSVDNMSKRPLEEKRALLDIYERYFNKLIDGKEIQENQTKINIFGRWEDQFPKSLVSLLRKGIDKTKHFTNNVLTFLLAYNGDDEILHAMKRIVERARTNEKSFEINETSLKESLLTSDLPDVDLLIRTGVSGDPHNSAGFLMWQTRNSQYYFSEKMFPDFGAEEFRKAVEDFSCRVRRFGK